MLITNIGQLVDGVSSAPLHDREIVIAGGKIAEVRPATPRPGAPQAGGCGGGGAGGGHAGDREDGREDGWAPGREAGREADPVIDARGGTVLPGLIDAHVHLDSPGAGSDPAGGDPTELWQRRLHDPDAVAVLRMVRNGQLALLAGITTVRDCSSRGRLFLSLREALNRGIFVGPRLVACGPPITTTGGHEHVVGVECDSAGEIRKAVRRLVKDGADFIKIISSGGFATPGSGVKKSQYSLAELKVAADEAHRMGRRIATHAHATLAIRYSVEAGIDTIEHCSWIGPRDDYDYGTEFEPEVAERMAANGIYMSKAFGAVDRLKERLWAQKSPDQAERHRRDRERHGALTRQMVDMGVRLVTGTDAGAGCTPIGDIAIALADWVRFCGLPALESIATATRTAAEAIGLGDTLGTLEPGKDADLIVLRGDPLGDLTRLREVDTVIVGGRVMVAGGRLVEPGEGSGAG